MKLPSGVRPRPSINRLDGPNMARTPGRDAEVKFTQQAQPRPAGQRLQTRPFEGHLEGGLGCSGRSRADEVWEVVCFPRSGRNLSGAGCRKSALDVEERRLMPRYVEASFVAYAASRQFQDFPTWHLRTLTGGRPAAVPRQPRSQRASPLCAQTPRWGLQGFE